VRFHIQCARNHEDDFSRRYTRRIATAASLGQARALRLVKITPDNDVFFQFVHVDRGNGSRSSGVIGPHPRRSGMASEKKFVGPIIRALARPPRRIKHRAHNREHGLARDHDPFPVREIHPCAQPRFATLAGPEIDSQRARAVSRAVGRYSSVFTVERARSFFGRRFLRAASESLSSAHNEGRRDFHRRKRKRFSHSARILSSRHYLDAISYSLRF